MSDDAFYLYDIKVSVLNDGQHPMICNHQVNDYFLLQGENLILPNNQSFPIYCLAALMPIITVKQRETDKNDWISTESLVRCPDPYCGGLFKIERLAKRQFHHQAVSGFRREDDE